MTENAIAKGAPSDNFLDRSVLVTGSSGFIGTHLVDRLVAAGAKVIGFDRNPPRKLVPGVQYITGDIRQLTAFNLPSVSMIFNLAAVHTTPGHPDAEYYDTNVNGALEVGRLAERDGAECIIFTSSISIYGPSEERKTEDSAPAPVSAYGKSKLMAEKIHENWLNGDQTRRLIVMRPAVVFGAGEGGNFARMAALLKKGLFIFPGRRDTIKSCIYVEDLIDLMFAANRIGERHSIINGSYVDCPTLEFIVTELKRKFFPRVRLFDVPTGLVIAAAKVLSALDGFGLGVHPDRVTKLIKSTHVYPEWSEKHGLTKTGEFSSGLDRWAAATHSTFI